jgi:hypothetical protein
MSPPPSLTDEQRRAHFSELGTRAVEARRARKAAVERLVETTRAAQGLPDTVSDIEVLERVAGLIEGGDDGAT